MLSGNSLWGVCNELCGGIMSTSYGVSPSYGTGCHQRVAEGGWEELWESRVLYNEFRPIRHVYPDHIAVPSYGLNTNVFRGCFQLNTVTQASPNEYKGAGASSIRIIYDDKTYSIQSCAERCIGFKRQSAGTALIPWSFFHTSHSNSKGRRNVLSAAVEFFGLTLGGSKCLCIGSHPPTDSSDTPKHKLPNAMEEVASSSCGQTCADGLFSCGSGSDSSIYSMFVLDGRGPLSVSTSTVSHSFSPTNTASAGTSWSVSQRTLGRTCQFNVADDPDAAGKQPFCVGADDWSAPVNYGNLPDGHCHPNVCGQNSCCRQGQSSHNCPVYDESSANALDVPADPSYHFNPFQKFVCKKPPGSRPRDPYAPLHEKEPLRYLRYWQIPSTTCDDTGENSANRCVLTQNPAGRLCNALYESDSAYFRTPFVGAGPGWLIRIGPISHMINRPLSHVGFADSSCHSVCLTKTEIHVIPHVHRKWSPLSVDKWLVHVVGLCVSSSGLKRKHFRRARPP